MQEQDLDRIAMQYLYLRGYKDVAAALQKEAKLTETPVPHVDRKEGIAQHLLFWNVARSDPAAYLASYDRFAGWVDNSLEQYRPELSRLLYPLLIYCYLDLVGKGATAQAHKMMTKAQRRFAEGQPQGKGRLQMLQDLSSVSLPQQLNTNKTAATLLGSRFPVKISDASLQLALAYLQHSRLMLLLNIINTRIKFVVLDTAPGSSAHAEDDEDDDMFAAAVGGDADIINRAVLQLNLLHNNLEDVFAERQLDAEDAEAAAAAEQQQQQEEGTKKTKRDKRDKGRSRDMRRAHLQQLQEQRMEPLIPLPELSPLVEASILDDMQHRVEVGPGALPSALMLTFLNSQQGLCCAAVSEDAALVAGGFQDSSVRLYDLPALLNAQPESMDLDGQDEAAQDNEPVPSSVSSCILHGHTDSVVAVDVAPGCELVLSGSVDGSVRLWSPELQSGLVNFSGHMFPVWDVAFAAASPYYFASAGADRMARVWCTERLHPLRMLAGHQADVDVVRWHPNAHYVATGSSDRTVRLWDVSSGKCVRLLAEHRAPVTALACSPDGQFLASGDANGAVMMWDLGSARRLATSAQHEGPVWSLAFSNGHTGDLLVSGGADHTVRVWDMAPGYAAAASAMVVGRGVTAMPELACWHTRGVGVFGLRFTNRNLVVGAGAISI